MTATHLVLRWDRRGPASLEVDGTTVATTDLPRQVGPALLALADQHPDATLAWCRADDDRLEDPATWGSSLRNEHEIRSAGLLHAADPWLATFGAADFDSALQLPPPADRAFGTWLLSPIAGVTTSTVLRAAGPPPEDLPLPAWLVVLGHRAYAAGALMWSDPALVRPTRRGDHEAVHTATSIAQAVRHTFGRPFLVPWLTAVPGARPRGQAAVAAVAAAARADRQPPPSPLHWPDQPVTPSAVDTPVDVVIPTLGRRELLLGVLDDLADQSVLPQRVIVVEQTGGGPAGLPIDGTSRPFHLEHLVIDRLGAGNARNVGLGRSDAAWVLMLDDDVRFAPDLVARLLGRARSSGTDALTAHLETVTGDAIPAVAPEGSPPALRMWPGFGSGGALVARTRLDEAGGFDRRIDGGFGEDTELGVRLRLAGAMVTLASDPAILHLKAPVGGMRAPFPHPWRRDPHRPRPSPTMAFARSTFETPAMAAGYRTHWWLDAIRTDGVRLRPLRRWQQWRSSMRWARRLAESEAPDEARAVPPTDAASRPRPPTPPAADAPTPR